MISVSIIIPTFNRLRYLGSAIDSALAQGEGIEVIVVDDGSEDGTDALLNRYGDRIAIERQNNQGPSAARNRGARRSVADYLFFLDSDDVLEPGAIAALLEAAHRLGTDKVPFGRASTIDEAGTPISGVLYGAPHLSTGHELQLAELVGRVMPLCLSLVPRRQFYALGGLRSDLRLGEDHEFAMRMHCAGWRYVLTDIPILKVRAHSGDRLSDTRVSTFGREALNVWSAIADLAREASDWDDAAAQALARTVWIAGRDAARGHDRQGAEALFCLAKSLHSNVSATDPTALRLLGKLVGHYRGERLAERMKSLVSQH